MSHLFHWLRPGSSHLCILSTKDQIRVEVTFGFLVQSHSGNTWEVELNLTGVLEWPQEGLRTRQSGALNLGGCIEVIL